MPKHSEGRSCNKEIKNKDKLQDEKIDGKVNNDSKRNEIKNTTMNELSDFAKRYSINAKEFQCDKFLSRNKPHTIRHYQTDCNLKQYKNKMNCDRQDDSLKQSICNKHSSDFFNKEVNEDIRILQAQKKTIVKSVLQSESKDKILYTQKEAVKSYNTNHLIRKYHTPNSEKEILNEDPKKTQARYELLIAKYTKLDDDHHNTPNRSQKVSRKTSETKTRPKIVCKKRDTDEYDTLSKKLMLENKDSINNKDYRMDELKMKFLEKAKEDTKHQYISEDQINNYPTIEANNKEIKKNFPNTYKAQSRNNIKSYKTEYDKNSLNITSECNKTDTIKLLNTMQKEISKKYNA